MQDSGQIRNISDTALWVAVYRARESGRSDALFHDPLASNLAGERGQQIAATMPFAERHAWSYIARTWVIDRFLHGQIEQGADMVINLAAGLDTRPYRMPLPAALKWVEVDLPGLLAYKQEILAGEQPRCALERVPLDLADVGTRRELFHRLGREAKRAVVVTEGLIVYFTEEEVRAFARDLAEQSSFRYWALDLASPKLLQMLQKALGRQLGQAGSPLRFAPREGPDFFHSLGWEPEEVHSLLQTAAKLKRLSLGMRLLALLPDPKGKHPDKPWGGVCVLANRGSR